MIRTNIQIAKDLLATPQRIAIIQHRNPDGDSMGSTLALSGVLRKLGHDTTVITPNDFPEYLRWMPSAESIEVFENRPSEVEKILHESTIVFTLDFNAFHRTGHQMEAVLRQLKIPFLMIDHHLAPDDYSIYCFSDTYYVATCQMIYDFIEELGCTHLIDKEIASCLYAGIVTDSGSFKYQATSATTHRIVANLLDKGVENNKIHNLLFDNNSYNRLKLLGRALENMVILADKKTAYITLSDADLREFDFQKGDSEGIVNYPLTIKGIEFSALFTENKLEENIRISFRSIDEFDVNVFARKYFNGGGHKNAAGGKSELSLEQTINQFIEAIELDNPNKTK